MMSCARSKPTCPYIPAYPGATTTGYAEQQETTRTTTYVVQASVHDVLSYLKQNLEQNGWSMVSDSAQGFSMDYITSSNRPPFVIGVRIDHINTQSVEYHVAIAINGPFFWENWCPTLKP
jgi:hypothetical protein